MIGKLVLLLALALPPEAIDFLKWYESYHGSFYPQEVLKAYRERLASEFPAPETERRIGVITKTMSAMPIEFTRLHFNKIYNSTNPPFRQEPSQFVMRIAEGLKPGAALDVAMGQGRNAVWLASKGWKVTGYDVADEGLRIARDAAQKAGFPLETVKASHEEFDLGKERWDLIVQAYAFTNLADEGYRKRLVEALKPGGVLLIEGFGGGPRNQMIEGFKDLRVIYYEDRDDIADWSMQKARLTRIAVQR